MPVLKQPNAERPKLQQEWHSKCADKSFKKTHFFAEFEQKNTFLLTIWRKKLEFF